MAKAKTVNNIIKDLALSDDSVILLKQRNEKMSAVKEYSPIQLKGDKRQIYYVRLNAGGVKHNYKAVLIVTEK